MTLSITSPHILSIAESYEQHSPTLDPDSDPIGLGSVIAPDKTEGPHYVTAPLSSDGSGLVASSFLVGGVRIDALQMDDAVQLVLAPDGPAAVHLCNAYTVALATKDTAFCESLNGASLNLPDGAPLVWVARWLGLPLSRRVYGPDLMQATLDQGRARGIKHYLYGSTPDVLAAMADRIEARWPGTEIVGVESPPFAPINDAELQASIQQMIVGGADVVWVGMGTPKQDQLVTRMAAMGPHRYVAIGAAFDFIAGTKKQAPKWLREHGLEWVFRLVSEPRRLWRRYVIGNSRFLWSVIRSRPTLHE